MVGTNSVVAPAAAIDDLVLALRIARQAGRVAAEAFDAPVRTVRCKDDGSEVTATDLAVEDMLRAQLFEHFPGDGVIGEERPALVGSSRRRWVIDPISGTTDFVHRVPLFSVDLAMEDAHGPAIAVSDLPASRLTMAAGRNLGCWVLAHHEQDLAAVARTRVSDRDDLRGAVVCGHGLRAWSTELIMAVHQRCALRDGVHSVLRLITGRADAVLVSGAVLGYEDLACLPVLVEQAGGRVSDLSGQPVLTGDGTVLASNGILHDAFLDLLADIRPLGPQRA